MKKFKLLFLLFIIATYAIAITPRLDAVEDNNAKLTSKLEESQKTLMQQELNNKNLENKIDELKSELEKLKDTQYEYRIEKNSYNSKMQSNTDLVTSQDKRLNDAMLYFTLFLGLFGIGTYLKAKHDAKETAQEFIDNWIKDKATPHLNTKISEVLNTKDDEINDLIERQIKDTVEPLLSSMKASLKDVEAHKDKAKIHIDELDKLRLKVKKTFKDISKEELNKIEAKEISSLTAKDHHKLGISALNKDKLNTALNEFKNVLKLSTDKNSKELTNTYYSMGNAYIQNKEYDKAIESYQKVVEINAKDDWAYWGLGSAYGNIGDYDKAIESFQRSIEINDKEEETHYNLGSVYTNKKEYDKAIESYKKAVEINPQKDGAYYNIGWLYTKLKKFDKAIAFYIKALNINPNKNSASINLFELQLTQNQPFDQELEKKYIELFQNQKESFIQYEMLKILQNITHKKEVNLEQWKQEYKGMSMGGWSFYELEAWIDGVEDRDLKIRLQETLEVFKGHG